MVRKEYVEKDHDCTGRYMLRQHAWDWVVEAKEKERKR